MDNEELITNYDIDRYHVFELMLSTHSGDLRSYPYLENSILRIDGLEILPAGVDVLSNDSHHTRVLLKFPMQNEDGMEYITPYSTLELLLMDLRDISERKFVFKVEEKQSGR